MAGVTEDNFAALQQDWVVISRVRGESSFHGQRAKRRADVIESGPFNQSKAGMPGREAAKQRDESGTEEQQTCRRTFREGPARDDVAPQERQNEKVPPYHQLEVVPIPRSGLDKITESENYDGRHHASNIRRRLVAPVPLAFPNAPSAEPNKPQRQRHP